MTKPHFHKRYCGTAADIGTVVSRVSPVAGTIYAILAKHCDWRTGEAFLTILQIAGYVGPKGVSERHAQRGTAELIALGILGRDPQFTSNRQRANKWTLFMPENWTAMAARAKAAMITALRTLQERRAAKRERLAALRGDINGVLKTVTDYKKPASRIFDAKQYLLDLQAGIERPDTAYYRS